MHVIVGQGQLDAVLHAKPEDRRAFIEEAAGVLKHRKRKEKALRKLEAMQANLNRLTDLTAELRRQLKPLGRQAEVARRAAGIQADLRDARLRLLADDLATLRETLDREIADETALRDRREEVEAEDEQVQERLGRAGGGAAADAPVLAAGAGDLVLQLSTLQERFRVDRTSSPPSAAATCQRRADDERPGRDPDQLAAEAEKVRGAGGRAARRARRATRTGWPRRSSAARSWSGSLADAERALVAARQGDRRPARGPGQAGRPGQRRAQPRRPPPPRRSSGSTPRSPRRRRGAETRRPSVRGGRRARPRPTATTPSWTSGTPRRSRRRGGRSDGSSELSDAERAAEKEAAQWKAREEALALGLRRKDGAGALLARADRVPGLLGSVAALLTVEPGYEAALAAALGALADAVAVSDVDECQAAIELLKTDDAGRAALLVGAAPADMPAAGRRGRRCPTGAALGARRGRRARAAAPGRASGRCATWSSRRTSPPRADRVVRDPELRAVTPEGDMLGAYAAAGGSAKQPSFIEVQAAVEEARRRTVDAERRSPSCASSSTTRAPSRPAAKQAVHEAAAAKQGGRGPAQRGRPAPRRARRGRAVGEGRGRAARPAAGQAEPARERDLAGLAELEERLRLAEETPIDADPSTEERDELAAVVPAARQHEMEVRLAVRTAEERVGALAGRADALARQAAAERAARERAAARRAARARGAAIAAAVVGGAAIGAGPARRRARRGRRAPRRGGAAARAGREAELAEVRGAAKQLGGRAGAADQPRCTATRWPGPSSGCGSSSWRRGRPRSSASTSTTLLGEYGPDLPVPPTAPESPPPRRRAAGARAGAVRPGRPRRSGPPRPSGSWPCSAR